MEMTTIALPKQVKEEIMEFGNKGESYSEILMKLIKSAKERQLHDILMDKRNTISIDKALNDAKKKWQE